MARGPVIPDDELRSKAEALLKSKPWMSRNEFIKEMHASWGRLRALGVKFPSKKTPVEVKMRSRRLGNLLGGFERREDGTHLC